MCPKCMQWYKTAECRQIDAQTEVKCQAITIRYRSSRKEKSVICCEYDVMPKPDSIGQFVVVPGDEA